jgi:hypothetical protein
MVHRAWCIAHRASRIAHRASRIAHRASRTMSEGRSALRARLCELSELPVQARVPEIDLRSPTTRIAPGGRLRSRRACSWAFSRVQVGRDEDGTVR